jgi:hypothetical protein
VKRVTRDVHPDSVHDLIERVPRASIAFMDGGRLEAAPVAYIFAGGHHWIGTPGAGAMQVRPHARVTLVIDEGWYWFELRAIRIRGTAMPAARPPEGGSPNLEWFQIAPARITAWDYGTLHEEESHGSG